MSSDVERTRKDKRKAKKNMKDRRNNDQTSRNDKRPDLLNELTTSNRSLESIMVKLRRIQDDLAGIKFTLDQLMNISALMRTSNTYLNRRSRHLNTHKRESAIIRTGKPLPTMLQLILCYTYSTKVTNVHWFMNLYVLSSWEVDQLRKPMPSLSISPNSNHYL